MPVCVTEIEVNGQAVLAAHPFITELENCAYVLQTPAEYRSSSWDFLGQISVEDSQLIAMHIGIVWAVAWGFKQIINLVRDLNPTERD